MKKILLMSCIFVHSFFLYLAWYPPQNNEQYVFPTEQQLLLERKHKEIRNDIDHTMSLFAIHARTSDEDAIRRVAVALTLESRSLDIPLELLYGVVQIENPWLDNEAVSRAGARGVMQIMPSIWGDTFPECGHYNEIEGNICIGARVLKYYMVRHSTTELALLSYNGCRPSWPCATYADTVYSFMEVFSNSRI